MPTLDPTLEAQADQFMKLLRRTIRPYGPDGPIDRGAAARLRALLSESTAHRGWPDLAAIAGANQLGDPVCQTVAALYALHPKERATGDFGTVCRELADGEAAFEPRFMQVLRARAKGAACRAITPVVRRAASQDLPIPWRLLFLDLRRWGQPVRLRWAQTYYNAPATDLEP
jgi:CRISPR type I-E-associated protein CasB/Cse2